MFGQITPVVKNLIILNVLVFIAATTLPNIVPNLALYYPGTEGFKPYQLVTHFFMHAGTQHLFFNMLGLFFLGPMVEQRLGGKDFLILYLCCAFGAVAAHLLVSQSPVVGASGAIYGVVIAFATLFPDMRLQLIFPPIPVKAKYLALFYIVGDLYHGLSGSQDNVAHFAHLGGALIGFLMVKFYFTSPNRR